MAIPYGFRVEHSYVTDNMSTQELWELVRDIERKFDESREKK